MADNPYVPSRPLKNPRHERMVQLLAQGQSVEQAYKIAGFRYDSGNASRMINAPAFQARLQILTDRRAQKVTTVCEVTTESLIAECEEARLMAIELKQPQSILAAIKEKGVLSGKRIERSETGEPGEFEGMNEQELAEYIGKKMAELGIEIVREEESEPSQLSST